MDRNIAKMERATMIAAVLGIILGFLAAGLSDGSGRERVIYITIGISFVFFAVFFIIIAMIKREQKNPLRPSGTSPRGRGEDFEEAEEVIIPEEEPSPSASLTPYGSTESRPDPFVCSADISPMRGITPKGEAREKFCFTNDTYDFLKGYGKVGEE